MKRPHVHLLIDGLLALSGLALVATGLLLEWVLPHGSRGTSVWGWTRHDWGEAHFWIALAILGLLLLHLALNWAWVCAVVTKLVGGAGKPGRWRRVAVGFASLALVAGILGGFLFAASASVVEDPEGAGRGRGQGRGWSADDTTPAAEHPGPGWRRGEGWRGGR